MIDARGRLPQALIREAASGKTAAVEMNPIEGAGSHVGFLARLWPHEGRIFTTEARRSETDVSGGAETSIRPVPFADLPLSRTLWATDDVGRAGRVDRAWS